MLGKQMTLTQAQVRERDNCKEMLADAIRGQPPEAIAFWLKDIVAETFTRSDQSSLVEGLSNAIGRHAHELGRG